MIYLESFGNFFPSFEKEEIEKIFKQQHYGSVEKIWVTPGLFLASTAADQVLHPICTHSASSSSSSVHWSLHIQTESAVLDVLINANPFNPALATIIYVVDTSGHVQCWQQSNATYVWKMVYRLHLANSHVDVLTPSDPLTSTTADCTTGTRVTTVCLLPEHHLMYWCEQQQRRQGTIRHRNTVYKLQLPGSTLEDSSSQKMPIERQIILQNCPPCSLYSLSCSILIVPDEMMKSGVPFGIVFTPMKSSCILYFGKTAVHHQISVKSGEPLNFKVILLQYQDIVKKTFGQFSPVLSSVFQNVKQEFVVILQSGTLLIWRENVPENGEVISKELSSFCDVSSDTKWTVSQDWLFATNPQETKVWNLTNGDCLQRILHTEEQIIGVFMVLKTIQISGLFTNEAIYLWQQEPPPLASGCLPPNNHYRSKALNVALLDQEKFQTDSFSAQRKLKELEKNWSEFKHQRAPTDYTRLTDPFLESYWLLEDFWQNAILSEEKVINPFPLNGSLEEIIHQLLNPSTNLPPETRLVQLMILANQYPALILTTFKTFLDFNSDVCEKELPIWQFVLGLDNNDLNRSNLNSQIFEVICQVIFKEEPQNLVPFVMKAQQAYELNIGVAAFTRERHTKKVYCEAYTCLPDANISKEPRQAVEAKVQLILKSESGHYILKSQDVLLSAGHWDSALSQLRHSITDKHSFRQLLHVTLKAMAKAQVLHKYMKDLSSLLTVNSHISLFELIEELVYTTEYGRYLQEYILSSSSPCKPTTKYPLYKDCPDIQYKCIQAALTSLSSLDLDPPDSLAPEESFLLNEGFTSEMEKDMLSPIRTEDDFH